MHMHTAPQVGFYNELLSFGYNVWACDADAVFVNDPRSMMREEPWSKADVAIATDCIDVPGDNSYPLLHCDFNTGLVYMRSRPEVIEFTDRWRETIANAKETRIRDQVPRRARSRCPEPVPVHGRCTWPVKADQVPRRARPRCPLRSGLPAPAPGAGAGAGAGTGRATHPTPTRQHRGYLPGRR